MNEHLLQKFEEAKKDICWHEDIVWDYDTIIKFFSHFNETCWSDYDIYRFFSKVKYPKDLEEGCWLWTASTTKTGYGRFGFKSENKRAHRLSHEFFFGEIPEGLCVLHICDIPGCVNPFDLKTGTHLDNMQDRNNKGRSAKGEQHGMYRYDKQILIDVLNKIKNGEIKGRQDLIFKVKENVSYNTINCILTGISRLDVGKLFDLEDLKNRFYGKLTDDQVREIRIRLKNGESGVSLSKEFKCNVNTISDIKNNKSYTYVKI